MFIPAHILPQLSPASAKTYLALLSLLDLEAPLPIAKAPMSLLTQLTGLSKRSCVYAIGQLIDLQLLRRAHRRYHTPNSYLLLDTNTQPVAPVTPSKVQPIAPAPASQVQTVAPVTPSHMQSVASSPPQVQPIAPVSSPTTPPQSTHIPISKPKSQNTQSIAPLLNQIADPNSLFNTNPSALLASLLAQLKEAHA